MSLPDAFGHTVFCDDIREEAGGKSTLVGAYKSDMLVRGEFPISLPKFGFAITFFERLAKKEGELSIQIYLPGDSQGNPSVEAKHGGGDFRETIPEQTDLVPPPEYRRIDLHLIAAPLPIKEEGLIKVRVLVGEERYKVGALRVRKLEASAPEPSPQSTSA